MAAKHVLCNEQNRWQAKHDEGPYYRRIVPHGAQEIEYRANLYRLVCRGLCRVTV